MRRCFVGGGDDDCGYGYGRLRFGRLSCGGWSEFGRAGSELGCRPDRILLGGEGAAVCERDV